MAKPPTTASEALQTQFLEDMDKLLTRLEQLDKNLSGDIADATAKSMMTARLNFEETVTKQRMELLKAGKEAAAEIRESLQSTGNLSLTRHGRVSLGIIILVAVAAGIAGGAICSLLSGLR